MAGLGPDRRHLRNLLVLLVLAALSLACTLLLGYRIRRTASSGYYFLTWNLMLAWIPVAAAFVAGEMLRTRLPVLKVLALPVAAVWLVFLPNAPYLATDLVHLQGSQRIYLWYDTAMLLGYAGTGVLLGFGSLLFMQDSVECLAGRAWSWLFVAGSLLLSSFGVYLGRFERFNSWEVFSSPAPVLEEVWLHVRDPFDYSHAYVFTLVIAALLLFSYAVLFGVATRGLGFLVRREQP